MAVENLLPDSDFIEFSNNDNEALTFTQQPSPSDLTDLSGDPPTKKKKAESPAWAKGKTVADLPVVNEKNPIKKKRWNFEEFETSLRQYADVDNRLNQPVMKGIADPKNKGLNFAPEAIATYNNLIQQKPVLDKRKKELIDKNKDFLDYASETLFGDWNDLVGNGNKISKFTRRNPAGQLVIDQGKVDQAIDNLVNESGGTANHFRYVKEHFRYALRGIAEQNLAVWKSKDNIKKRVQDGVITKEEIEKSILDLNNEFKAKVKTAVDVQDDLYNQKIIGLQRDYEPVLADLDMDVNFYRQQVEKDVADEVNKEFTGMTGIPQSTIQNEYNRRVKEQFDIRFGEYVKESVQPIVESYVNALREEFRKANEARNRILAENNELLKKKQKELINKAANQNKKTQENYSNIVKEEVANTVKREQAISKAYTQTMMDLSVIPNSPFLGKIFSDSFVSGLGNFISTTGLFLNGLGFEANWIDDMRYAGKSMEVGYAMDKSDIKNNFMKPGFWGQSLATSAPIMLPSIAFSLAGMPYVGAAISVMAEGSQLSGGVMEGILQDGGDFNKAAIAGKKAFIYNLPTYVLELAMQRMFVPFKLPETNVIRKGAEYAVGIFGNSAQEIIQGGIEKSLTKGGSVWSNTLDKESLQAGIEAGGMSAILGGAGISFQTMMAGKTPPIPNVRSQAIATTILKGDVTGAIAGVQMQGVVTGATDEQITQGIAEVQRVNDIIEDAKTIGLSPSQTQLFVAHTTELDELNQKRQQVKDPVAGEVLDKQIEQKKKEIEAVVNGETPVATIDMAGVIFTVTAPNIGTIIKIPEIREGLRNGTVRIETEDAGLQNEIKAAIEEQPVTPEVKQETPEQQPVSMDDNSKDELIGALFEQMPNVQGLYGKFLEGLTDPNQQQFVLDAVVDQYKQDFEAASARYGEKVTELVRPIVQENVQPINQQEPLALGQGIADAGNAMTSNDSPASQNTPQNATTTSEQQQQEGGTEGGIGQYQGTNEGQQEPGQVTTGQQGQNTQPQTGNSNRNSGGKKKAVKLTRQERVNNLVDAVRKADNTSDKTTKARMVNQIKLDVQALNRAFPKNKIVFNEKRMRIETESGNKINKRNTVKNSTVAKEFSRDQYSDKTNEVIDAILGDENIANGFYIRGVDGMMLSVKQLSDAINGIRNGKVTEGGKALFDFIEESVNTGEVEIRDRATGVSDRVSLDEYMAAMKEVDAMYVEGTMPMTEWQVRNWLNEEAANNYEEETFDNVDNLPQYEQDITGFREGAEQQPSIERATGESAAGQEGAGVTEVTPGTDRNAPSQQEVEAKRREYEAAQRKLSEAEDKLAKEQGQQTDMFGDRGVQQGMFAPTDAKEILDPLRQKVKEAKAAYEQAQKEFENEQLRQQPILQLGNGSNVYFEADKYRVNDNNKNGNVVLNIQDNQDVIPVANIEFDDPSEAVFVAERLNSVYPKGVPQALLLDRYISDLRNEYKNNNTPQNATTTSEQQQQEGGTEGGIGQYQGTDEGQQEPGQVTTWQQRQISFRKLYERRVLAEKNMGAIISELQSAIADIFNASAGTDLSKGRVALLIKKLSVLNDMADPELALLDALDEIDYIVAAQENADLVSQANANLKKVYQKAKKSGLITERYKNFIKALDLPKARKVLLATGATTLSMYNDLLNDIVKGISGIQLERKYSIEQIDNMVKDINRIIAEYEQSKLAEKVKMLIDKGKFSGVFDKNGGIDIQKSIEKYLEEKSAETKDREIKDGKESILRKFLPELQKQVAKEISNIDDKRLQAEAKELSSVDVEKLDADELSELNDLLNNVLLDQSPDGVGNFLARVKAKADMEGIIAKADQMIVRPLNKETIDKKSLNVLLQSLFFNEKAWNRFRSIVYQPWVLAANRTKAYMNGDKGRNGISKQAQAIIKKYGLETMNFYRTEMYKFLNRYNPNIEETRQEQIDAAKEKLINQAIAIYNEGIANMNGKKETFSSKKLKAEAIMQAESLKSLGIISDYSFDVVDGKNTIKLTANEDFLFNNISLSEGESEWNNFTYTSFSELADDAEYSARSNFGQDFQREENYTPFVPVRLRIDNNANADSKVDGSISVFQDYGKKLSKQPTDRFKKRGRLAGDDYYYSMNGIENFYNGIYETKMAIDGGRSLIQTTSIINGNQFAKFVNGSFNPAFGEKNFMQGENAELVRTKLAQVYKAYKYAPFKFTTSFDYERQVGQWVYGKTIETIVSSIDQIIKQPIPAFIQGSIDIGPKYMAHALQIITSALQSREAAAAINNFFDNTSEEFRDAQSLDSFHDTVDKYNMPMWQSVASVPFNLFNYVGKNALVWADKKVANRVLLLAGYLKGLQQDGQLNRLSDFNIKDHIDNPNMYALSNAEASAQRINATSAKAEKADAVKFKANQKWWDFGYTLRGFQLDAWNNFANNLRIAFDKSGYMGTYDADKFGALRRSAAYVAQSATYAAITTFVTGPIWQSIGALAAEWMVGKPSPDDDDKEKEKKTRRMLKLAANVSADAMLGGQSVYVDAFGKFMLNKLYATGQEAYRNIDGGTSKDYKGGFADNRIKPYFVEGSNAAIETALGRYIEGVEDAIRVTKNNPNDPTAAMWKDRMERVQLALIVLNAGDLQKVNAYTIRALKEYNAKIPKSKKTKNPFDINLNLDLKPPKMTGF